MFICEIGCLIGIFLNSANLICRSTDISKCLEITRVDCTVILGVEHLNIINFAFGTSRKLTVFSVSIFKNIWNKWKINGFR